MQDRLARAIRQDAKTASLLGVDFVPARVVPEPELPQPSTPEQRSAETPIAPPDESHAKPPIQTKSRSSALAEPATKPARAASTPIPASSAADDRASRQRALDALRAKYEADAPHKHFVTAHTNIVFGDGDPCARLMFIGEAPGADEDREGIPFVGRAGQLLNKMIVAMGLSRESVYIANVLKTRPPGNATPTSEEAKLCAPYLYGQIAIIRPSVIVTLGLPATRLMLDSKESMGRLRGCWKVFKVPEGHDQAIIPATGVAYEAMVMPTYHPAFLLRSYTKENREKVWSDLKQAMDHLGLATP